MNKGDVFPPFSFFDENGEIVNNKNLDGLRFVLFFFERTDSDSIKEFSNIYAKLMFRNVISIGVGPFTRDELTSLKKEYSTKVKLVSDSRSTFSPESRISSDSVFLIGKDGRIEDLWEYSGAKTCEQVVFKVISLFRIA